MDISTVVVSIAVIVLITVFIVGIIVIMMRERFDAQGYDKEGYDRKGYNDKGFNRKHIHKNGTNFDDRGCDFQGFNKDGYTHEGFQASGSPWWHERNVMDAKVPNSELERKIQVESAKPVHNNLINDNAYVILGLRNHSSIKNLTRRAKEIERLSKIDQAPEYDEDLPFLNPIRDDATVKQAIQNLSDPRKKITESFFWFDIVDDEDKVAFEALATGQVFAAFARWNNKYTKHQDVRALKNLVIAETMYLTLSGSEDVLGITLEDWNLLINDDAFWAGFVEDYNENDELGADVRLIHSFRRDIVTILADYYYRISMAYDNDEIATSFVASFGVVSKRFREDKIVPLLKQISQNTEGVKTLHSRNNSNKSPLAVANLQDKVDAYYNGAKSQLERLKAYGFESEQEVKTLCEETAQAIRNLAIDVLNGADADNMDKSREIAKSFLEKAQKLATTRVLTDRIKGDFDDIENQKKFENAMKNAEAALKRNDFIGAQAELFKLFSNEKDPSNKRFLAEQLTILRKAELNQTLQNCFNNKNWYGALRIVNQLLENETEPSEMIELREVKWKLERIINPYESLW